jgi:hypothetical protein
MTKKYLVTLTAEEREQLENILSRMETCGSYRTPEAGRLGGSN